MSFNNSDPVQSIELDNSAMPLAAEKSPIQRQAFFPAAVKNENDEQSEYRSTLRNLLRVRLRVAALILAAGFFLFLLRDLLLSFKSEQVDLQLDILLPYIAITIVLAGIGLFLCTKYLPRLIYLRMAELAVFGLPAFFFNWVRYCELCQLSSTKMELAAHAFPSQTIVPWMLLIFVYGVFIPNGLRRAIVVVSILVLIPIGGALATGIRHSAVYDVLSNGGFSTIVLSLGLAAFTAIFGSHRLGSLRRENFAARRVGSYNLKEKIGSGGMGDVYLAEHHLLKRPCAIKLIRANVVSQGQAIARFESEVQSTAGLTHPNTIAIYDYGHTEDGVFYYAMEYLPGLNLQEIVERYGPLPADRLVYLLVQVCGALQEAHSHGLIHRDIKPGNIIAAERGGMYDVAKLLDFGLVKSTNPKQENMNNTIDGTVVGSPLYTAPEITMGDQAEERSDIYAVGATAYFLLTGRPVFTGDNAIKVLFSHVNDAPEPLSKYNNVIQPDLEAVIMKCLAKKVEDRYANVTELAIALDKVGCRKCWSQERAAEWWHTRCHEKYDLLAQHDEPGIEDTVHMLQEAEV